MNEKNLCSMKLFLTAFIQVSLVTIQTWFIAKEMLVPIFLVGFGISFVWTLNVKSVAFGGNKDRLIYAFGAACGALTAMLISKLF